MNLVSVCFLLIGFFFRIRSYLPIIIRVNLIIIFTLLLAIDLIEKICFHFPR